MLRYFAKRVCVTESEVSDKRHRDGIGGEASVNVTIGRETSVTVSAVDNESIRQPGRSSGNATGTASASTS